VSLGESANLTKTTKHQKEEIMRRVVFFSVALTSLAILLLPFYALGQDKTNYFTIKGGIYSPESDDLEDFDEGFAGEVALGHYFNPNFALELGLGYLETDGRIRDSGLRADGDIEIYPLTLTAKGILPLGENAELYGLAGGGVYFTESELDISGGPSLDDSDDPLGVHVGLGGNFNITENMSIGIEGKYFWAEAETKDAGMNLDYDLDGFIVTAALTFYFGGKEAVIAAEPEPNDSDGDGVYDDMDKCPGTPVGVKVDMSGCPLDSDGDGVYDDQDKCPGTPKGVKVDRSGCPLDSDGDGVYDDKDECPDTPKGVKVDQKGCPVVHDSDGDGVPDDMDKCPQTPKGATVNEFGCWVCKGLNFDFNKWDIKPKYHPCLDEVATYLKSRSDLSVEIQGHTDNIGSQEYNQRLSEKRALAVMNYFVSKGIAEQRLSVKGFGFSKPVATNKTEEGRAKNRRVELKPMPE